MFATTAAGSEDQARPPTLGASGRPRPCCGASAVSCSTTTSTAGAVFSSTFGIAALLLRGRCGVAPPLKLAHHPDDDALHCHLFRGDADWFQFATRRLQADSIPFGKPELQGGVTAHQADDAIAGLRGPAS